MPICTRKNVARLLDPGHRLGKWSPRNKHGVASAVCRGCGGIAVEHPSGRVDPERHLLGMTCEQAQNIAAVGKMAVGLATRKTPA